MSELQLGPVVGTIGGGGDVEVHPFTVTASGGTGAETHIFDLNVPEGETWMVVVNAAVSQGGTGDNTAPFFLIGDIRGRGTNNSVTGMGAIVTSPADVRIRRAGSSLNGDVATGTIYISKVNPIPD